VCEAGDHGGVVGAVAHGRDKDGEVEFFAEIDDGFADGGVGADAAADD